MVNLLDSKLYWAYWHGVRRSHPTDKDAYLAVENEMITIYGSGMYESYDTWRVAKHRYDSDLVKRLERGEITKDTLSDIMTIPGYMQAYDLYKQRKQRISPKVAKTATLFETSAAPDDDPKATEEMIWSAFNHNIESLYGICLYMTYSAFRSARQRYIQSLHKRKYKTYKTKVKKS